MKNCDLVEKNTNIYITTGASSSNTRQTRVIRLKSINKNKKKKIAIGFFLKNALFY